jgi:PAT family acetyl-CoA transporter-like MFS transporter 1
MATVASRSSRSSDKDTTSAGEAHLRKRDRATSPAEVALRRGADSKEKELAKDGRNEPAADDHKQIPGDYGSIILLLVLYTLQGLPMGLNVFVKMRLKEMFKGEFSQIATFALTTWPFSLKFIWAPIVDACYVERFGRRKTWLVPTQVLIGCFVLYLAASLEFYFEARDHITLTALFFMLYFLCATQDIAVDGWSVTMLHPANAGYSSTCNAAGQGIGFFLGMVLPTMGVASVSSIFTFIGLAFLATTIAIVLLKREAPTPPDEQLDGIVDAYRSLGQIMRLRPVQILFVLLLTRSIPFIPMDEMALGKLQDAGLQTQHVAWLRSATTPLEFVIPWVLTRLPAWKRPLNIVYAGYMPRVLLTALAGVLVYVIGTVPEPMPVGLTVVIAALNFCQGVAMEMMFGSFFAFFAIVSDPKNSGTYMTVLSSLHNLGNAWAVFACLKSADQVERYIGFDGFYCLCGGCVCFGIIWFEVAGRQLKKLQDRPVSDWRVRVVHW